MEESVQNGNSSKMDSPANTIANIALQKEVNLIYFFVN